MLKASILLAFREIRRHLMRSFLTTLGIVIGVAAVVTMVTLGNGATAAVADQIKGLGSNVLMVRSGQGPGRGASGPPPRAFKLVDADLIADQVAGVTAVAPMAQGTGTAIHDAQSWSTQINATTQSYFLGQAWAMAEGRTFTNTEEQAGKSVCIIGETIRKNLFRESDAIGARMRISGISCEVIGVLAKRGAGGFGNDQDDVVAMPIKTYMRRIAGNQDVRGIQVSVDAAYDSQAVQSAVKALLRERRNLSDTDEDDFVIFDSAQIAQTLEGSTRIMTGFLAAVASVSLLVGGIGIMNIMLVSVTERTREIGIRLAIGAIAREVLTQFLVEAVVLSCLGGLIGLVLALLASLALAPIMGVPFAFAPKINLIAFAFSALIGIVFGYFPARRAAALNPIEALRHE